MRWQRLVKAFAVLSIVGILTLSGCETVGSAVGAGISKGVQDGLSNMGLTAPGAREGAAKNSNSEGGNQSQGNGSEQGED